MRFFKKIRTLYISAIDIIILYKHAGWHEFNHNFKIWRIIRNHGIFDPSYYSKTYPDVAAAETKPLIHYITIGALEGRSPHMLFDAAYYYKTYKDVEDARANPLVHFLLYGAAQRKNPSPLFDTSYYTDTYPEVAANGLNPLEHYLLYGATDGLNPCLLFDAAYYLKNCPDVAATGGNPLIHYLIRGAAEGRNPHPLFDSSFYLRCNPEVAAAGINPLVHYVTIGAFEGCSPHPLFNAAYYCETHNDVADAHINPLVHFLLFGADQGYDPSPLFNTSHYVGKYPDVAASGLNPLVHYLFYGAADGLNPCLLFDEVYYLKTYPEVAVTGGNPLNHYLTQGAAEGRNPHPLFDGSFYLRCNPEVAAAGINPLVHYVTIGAFEGRSPHPLFNAAYYCETYKDVADAHINPLVHFLLWGAKQGRDPNPLFNTSYYVGMYPEVAASGLNPLVHYLYYGAAGGRNPCALFDTAYYLKTYPEVAAAGDDPLIDFLVNGARLGRTPHPALALESGSVAREKGVEAAADEAPDVSIIILNFNKATLTLHCLESLWRYTEGCRYEIIVVDNGSEPGDAACLAAHGGQFRLIQLRRNCFFGEGNNIGAEMARGRFLLFLNNDTLVTPNWLSPLLAVFADCTDAGAVGPKLVFPNGKLQEAGALIDETGGSLQRGKFAAADDPCYNEQLVVDYVSAAAVLMRRNIFFQVLGFDIGFEPAYCEDMDLCMKIALLGLRTYYCPTSTVIHFENATSRDPRLGLRLNVVGELHQAKFVERWGQHLRSGRTDPPLVLPAASAPLPAETNSGGLALRVARPLSMENDTRYLLSIAQAFRSNGPVTLETPDGCSFLRLRTLARDYGLALDHVRPISAAQAATLPPPAVSVVLSDTILPPLPANGRVNIVFCPVPRSPHPEDLPQFSPLWAGYDTVVVPSDFAASRLRQLIARMPLPHRPLQVIAPSVSPSADEERSADITVRRKPIIAAIGTFAVDGADERYDLILEAFRALFDAADPAAAPELHLFGSLPPGNRNADAAMHLRRSVSDVPVFLHFMSDVRSRRRALTQASLYWHADGLAGSEGSPWDWGLLEAMAAGCVPVVAAAGAPGSRIQHGINGFRTDSVSGLVSTTLGLLREEAGAGLAKVRRHARDHAGTASFSAFAGAWNSVSPCTAAVVVT